ncbi:hypothetical protein FBY10_101596 [Pseudomonas sp. SJZ103]|nr:hypothetical protein FBY10_101596 [Pseudomonas sp. SJZ103]TWC92982.1 hypothetical protein FBY08_101462 [Pseudomonas sp. SJZ094]
MVLGAGTELLLQGQPFVLLYLLLAQGCLGLLTERLGMDSRLPLQLRPQSPSLYLPGHRH